MWYNTVAGTLILLVAAGIAWGLLAPTTAFQRALWRQSRRVRQRATWYVDLGFTEGEALSRAADDIRKDAERVAAEEAAL